MPLGKKAFQKQQGVYYSQAIVQGKPVEMETIAKDLAKISTVSNSDVQEPCRVEIRSPAGRFQCGMHFKRRWIAWMHQFCIWKPYRIGWHDRISFIKDMTASAYNRYVSLISVNVPIL